MTLNDNKRLVVARQMGAYLKKYPNKPLSMDMVFRLASANATRGLGGKKVILQRAGICRQDGGEIKTLSDPDWREVWCTLSKLKSEGFVSVGHTGDTTFKYDPMEDKSVKQVLTPKMAQENLRTQIAEALIELVYTEGVISKQDAKRKICERFGYKDIKHTLWGPIVSRCTRKGIGGRKIVIDKNDDIYTTPDLIDKADVVAAEAEEKGEPVEKIEFVPAQVTISSSSDGTTVITLEDGTQIVRDTKKKTIQVKTPKKGWQVIVSSLLNLL